MRFFILIVILPSLLALVLGGVGIFYYDISFYLIIIPMCLLFTSLNAAIVNAEDRKWTN